MMSNQAAPPLPSHDAIHEAGHAVVAAVMGMPDIWITVISNRLQCECGSKTPNTYEALAVSYGGYAADNLINSRSESDCLLRSTTDAKHRKRIVESHARMYSPDIDWQNQLAKAEAAAMLIVEEQAEDVIHVAREIDKYIASKSDIPRDVVEQWQGIQAARAFGLELRQQQSDVTIQ